MKENSLEYYRAEVLKVRPKAEAADWERKNAGCYSWSILDRSVFKCHIGNGETELLAWKDALRVLTVMGEYASNTDESL